MILSIKQLLFILYIGVILELYKENGNYYNAIVYWGYTGLMEKKMETTIVYWGQIGIMEKKMETTTKEA